MDRKRIEAAHRYRVNLAENKKIKMMEVKEGNKCVYHIFPIFIRNRNSVQQALLTEGVQTGLHYPKSIHLQKAYKHLKHKEVTSQLQKNKHLQSLVCQCTQR